MKPTNYTKGELQELTLMSGSKKGLGLALGVDHKKLEEIWKANQLRTPVEYVRSLSREDLTTIIGHYRSAEKAAAYLGVSTTTLYNTLSNGNTVLQRVTADTLKYALDRYGSVAFTARMLHLEQTDLRKLAAEANLNLAELISYEHSGHSNGKGRRAELDFARLRGVHIQTDHNTANGSQFDYDFTDDQYGKVNVKSSRRYRYRARSRRDQPYYWKFSAKALEKADHVALMCYDDRGASLLFHRVLEAAPFANQKSFTLNEQGLINTECLSPSPIASSAT